MRMVLRRHETGYPDAELLRISRGDGHALNAVDGIPTI